MYRTHDVRVHRLGAVSYTHLDVYKRQRYVYEKLCTEEKLVKYFRTSFVPSELCIQTIVFNSPFASKGLLLEGEYPGLTRLTPLHYIDYGASIRVMTLEDLPVLQQSGKMFCRKVVSGESDTLIEKLKSDFAKED